MEDGQEDDTGKNSSKISKASKKQKHKNGMQIAKRGNGKKKNNNGSKKGSGKDNGSNIKWIILIWISSFFLSGFFSIISSGILSQVNILIAVIVLVSIIIINIIFDIIGTASTAADSIPFHSMAARKVKGAKEAITLIKHADKVSNFCNDVIGDICGILSGAAAAYIVLKAADRGLFTGTAIHSVIEIILSGLVASLTVGGKSIGKSLAINKSNDIIYKVALLIRIFKRR
jgi:hypothetical protein